MKGTLLLLGLFFPDPYPDLPSLVDVERFPSYEVCCAQSRHRQEHARDLAFYEQVLGYHPVWEQARQENNEALETWRILEASQCSYSKAYWARRKALADLCDFLGPDRYAKGWVPIRIKESGLKMKRADD